MNILTIKELSSILKVNPKTLYQWAELGQIPSIKLGRCLRFDLDEITAWVKSCTRQPDSGYNSFITQTRGPKEGRR